MNDWLWQNNIHTFIQTKIITMDNFNLIYNALTVYGSVVVNEVIELAICCDLQVAHDTFTSMNMGKYAECIDYLFFEAE